MGGVLKQGDFEAILAGIGKVVSSVPVSTVMGVYSEMAALVGGASAEVPANLFSKQNTADAMAAYSALIDFKDTVRKAQMGEAKGNYDRSLDMQAVLRAIGFFAAPAAFI